MGQMRETETKYRVSDIAELEVALHAKGVSLSPPVRQDDQAYAEKGWHYGMTKCGMAFARLRTESGRHIFTLKRPIDNEQSCLEFETEIADRAEMHQALDHMGFYPTVRIIKTRRMARICGVTICVDLVEHIGAFIELEKMVNNGEAAHEVQTELDAFARSLPIRLERTTDTYDSLVRASLEPV